MERPAINEPPVSGSSPPSSAQNGPVLDNHSSDDDAAALAGGTANVARHRRRRRRLNKKTIPPANTHAASRPPGPGGAPAAFRTQSARSTTKSLVISEHGLGPGGSPLVPCTKTVGPTSNRSFSSGRELESRGHSPVCRSEIVRSSAKPSANYGSNHHRNAKGHPRMNQSDLYLSMKCGMVTIGADGTDVAVGRVIVVNWDSQVELDAFVKVPPELVHDYRTESTGITSELLAMPSALRFDTARSKIAQLIRGKILIGHGLGTELRALGLGHPWRDVRDTASYLPCMKNEGHSHVQSSFSVPRELDELMHFVLGKGLNEDQQPLVRSAIGCLEIYKHIRFEWEQELAQTVRQRHEE